MEGARTDGIHLATYLIFHTLFFGWLLPIRLDDFLPYHPPRYPLTTQEESKSKIKAKTNVDLRKSKHLFFILIFIWLAKILKLYRCVWVLCLRRDRQHQFQLSPLKNCNTTHVWLYVFLSCHQVIYEIFFRWRKPILRLPLRYLQYLPCSSCFL